MSHPFADERIARRPVQFSPVDDLPSEQSEIAAYMLGMLATSALIIGLTYAAIGLGRVLS
ncbi:hypothetical protein V1291_005196 [Nitrobacteraceae bacterium AZCC 1564]